MLQNYTFPATGRQIQSSTNFFKYESVNAGASDEGVLVRADGQALGVFYPGDSVRLPFTAVLIEVTPVTNAAGMVRCGVGDIVSNRMVMSGSIAVIDAALNRTKSGKAYSAAVQVSAAGQILNAAQIWNGGTTNLYIRSATCSNAVLWIRNTQIAPASPAAVFLNKNPGFSAPAGLVGKAFLELAAYTQGAGSLQVLTSFALGAEPLILPPGWGLNAQMTANQIATLYADLYEE